MTAVSVIIPARNAAGTLGACLDALAAQDLDRPFEVIVADDGSSDATADLAEGHRLAPRVLRRERGAGAGAARNDGVRVAQAAVLAFTDADCAPGPRWLAAGLAALEAGAGIVQGAVRPLPGVPIGPFDHTLTVASEYGLYQTANLFVRREWFDRVGGFEDWLNAQRPPGSRSRVPERPFGEDTLFVWRARRAGASTAFAPDALVHHAVFAGTAREYVAERRRDRHFASLTALIPELRDGFLYRRVFLNRRSAAFDLAVLGAGVAVSLRRPLALGLAVPWLKLVRDEAGERTDGPLGRVALAVAAGDAVGFGGLVGGSVRSRSPVL